MQIRLEQRAEKTDSPRPLRKGRVTELNARERNFSESARRPKHERQLRWMVPVVGVDASLDIGQPRNVDQTIDFGGCRKPLERARLRQSYGPTKLAGHKRCERA